MPDQDAAKPVRTRTRSASAHPPEPSSGTEPDEESAHLSEAARGVIRQSADPRLDAHLARMLSADEATAPAPARESDAALRADVERLTAELATARAAAEAAGRHVISLGILLGVALLAIVILLVVAIR
jgi:hypothetical protein